ncbi:uncharacterized protein LOC117336822 [Pecten maximus]|uniref:uncharacterized protein LOC117336822 n=1 Tax=Pecten maximus TaxID=6579 RepID=UPI0014586751|nr:uncharacterized protein LOC117336822 [Pecten maximus]
MDIKIFLIFVVILNAMQQGPAAYRDLKCVEPEPGHTKRLLYYFTSREIEQVCPTQVELMWRIGNDVFRTFLCGVITLMLVYTYVCAPSIGNRAKKRWTTNVCMFQAWITRRSLCRFCGTSPCQAKRTSWKRFRLRIKNVTDFEERSNAMRLFSLGLELSVDLTKELPRDELYWARKYCDQFEEDHMVLFPLCIQRQINDWYPLPH